MVKLFFYFLFLLITVPITLIFSFNTLCLILLRTSESIKFLNNFQIRIAIKTFRKILLAFVLLLFSYMLEALIFVLIMKKDPLNPEYFLINSSFTTLIAFILYFSINNSFKGLINYLYFRVDNMLSNVYSFNMKNLLPKKYLFKVKKEAASTMLDFSANQSSLKNSSYKNTKKHFFSIFLTVEPNEIKYTIIFLDSLVLMMTAFSLLFLSYINSHVEHSENSILYYTFVFLSIIIAKIHANHEKESSS